MGFNKQQAAKKVEEDNDAAIEASMAREAASTEELPVSGVEMSEDTSTAADASVAELSPTDEQKPEEENDLPAETLDDQLLAGGGMELSDESLEQSPVSGENVAPASAAETSTDSTVEASEAPSNDDSSLEGARPRLERVLGNGNPLSPNEQRKAALEEKAASMPGYGGGGGGIGSLFAAAGQGVKSVLSGVGTGVKRVGGQKLADRFLQPSDPVSVAKRAFRQRYAAYDGAINDMDTATKAREASVKNFNELVLGSSAGRTLNEIAQASNVDVHDLMSDVKSGKNRDPLALRCMETLERDPDLGRAAKKITAAQDAFTAAEKVAETNFTRLATDHGADVNVAFESNRLVDAFEKAETDVKKPLPLEVSLKDSNTGAEDKLDTEKQHKKFMEALEKIKESISALLSKIMSKLGLGGPK